MCADLTWVPQQRSQPAAKRVPANLRPRTHQTPLWCDVDEQTSRSQQFGSSSVHNVQGSVTAKLESSLVSLAAAWPVAPLLSSPSSTAPYHHHHHLYHPFQHQPHHPLYSSLFLGATGALPATGGVIQVRSPAAGVLLSNSLARYQPQTAVLATGTGNTPALPYDCCSTSPPPTTPSSVYRGSKSSAFSTNRVGEKLIRGSVSPSSSSAVSDNNNEQNAVMALEAVEKRLSVSPHPRTPDSVSDISSSTLTAVLPSPGHHHHHHHHQLANPMSVGSSVSTGLLSPNSTMDSRPNSATPPLLLTSTTPPLPVSVSSTPVPPLPPVTPSSSRTTPPSSVTSTSPASASVSPHTSHHIAAMGLLLSTSPHSPMPRRPDSTSSTSSSASSASSSLDHHHYPHHHHHHPHHVYHPHHLTTHSHQRIHPHLAMMAAGAGGVLSHNHHHLHNNSNIHHHQRDNPAAGFLGLPDNNMTRSLKFSIENILRPDFGRVTLKAPSSRDGSNKDTDDEHSSSSGSSSTASSLRNHHHHHHQSGSHRSHHHNHHRTSSTSAHHQNNSNNANAKSSHHHHGQKSGSSTATANTNASAVSSSRHPPTASHPTSAVPVAARQRTAAPQSPAATVTAAAGAVAAAADEDTLPAPGSKSKSDNPNMVWPAWVYCTRYSDRPSSGPRSRRMKKKDKKPEEKRPRTAFTNEQLARLKKEFQENRYLTEKRRQDLARELQLNESQIKIWFQNKRAKIKKANGQRNGLALHLMAQGLYNHTTSSKDGEMDDNDMMDDDHDDE